MTSVDAPDAAPKGRLGPPDPARCKVAVVARSEADKVTLLWERPHTERAGALGGPIVRCHR